MTLVQHIRLAGAVTCIVAAIMRDPVLSFIGLMVVAVGALLAINSLEQRIQELEKGDSNES